MKVLVIANPIAGGGRGRSGGRQLAGALLAAGCEVELLETDGPEAVSRRIRAGGVAGIDRIASVGGDGTLNDLVNALPEPGAIPLAQLALGTANILARELGLPRTPEAVAELVLEGSIRPIDLGRAGEVRFFGNASSGLDAAVVHELARRRSGALPGMGAYVAPTLRLLRRYEEPRLAACLDDGSVIRGGLVIASNLRNFGGIFHLAEDARPDSGYLHLCVFERARIPDLARLIALGVLGRLGSASGVRFARARQVRIESEAAEPMPVQIDGDPRGTTPLELSVEPGALPVLVPA